MRTNTNLPFSGRIDIQQDYAAELFRAMNGDDDAMARVTIGEVAELRQADTFEEFLKVNNMTTFEEVVR